MNRLEMLRSAGLLAGAAAVNSAAQTPSAATEPPRKLKFVVAGGHPGDPEYGCGGTVARLTALGHDVALLYMHNGAGETSALDAQPTFRPMSRNLPMPFSVATPLSREFEERTQHRALVFGRPGDHQVDTRVVIGKRNKHDFIAAQLSGALR
jgi:hypothetical protein